MKHTIVIIKILTIILFSNLECKAQKVKKDSLFNGWERVNVKKEVIYLKFKVNNGDFPKYRCKKLKNNKGVQFNLCEKGSLFFSKEKKPDTLFLNNLTKYNISSIKDIDKKVKDFRQKTYKKLPMKSNRKLYQAYDNNDIFETFLIEIISEDKFVVYPVFWRNQRIQR